MGITNGGPFGTMINKTGNLVFRKVKKNNVVTIYVPNPRDPKSPSQTGYRALMKRTSQELTGGIKSAAAALYKDIRHVPNPYQHVISKTLLNVDVNNLPSVIFPVFDNFKISRILPTNFKFNPFFDQLTFDLPAWDPNGHKTTPLLLILGFDILKNEWFVVPGATIMADGYQGVCREAGLIDEHTAGFATYNNYLYCGVSFWLEIDEWTDYDWFHQYVNDIQPNYFSSFMKSERGDYNYSPIVLTEENLKELRNYVPGVGYTQNFKKNQLFTPTLLNKISGKPLTFSQPSNFYSDVVDIPDFSKYLKLDNTINYNNFSPTFAATNILDISAINTDSVEEALKTTKVDYIFYKLVPSGEGDYNIVKETYKKSELPTELTYATNISPNPMGLILCYKNRVTDLFYFDFCKHWADNSICSLLSQLEFYYNVFPQRFNTTSGNCGIYVKLFYLSGDKHLRAGQYTVQLSNDDGDIELTGTTDDFGNLFFELNGGEMEIVGLGFDRGIINKCVVTLGAENETFILNCKLSGNNYSWIGEIVTTIQPA